MSQNYIPTKWEDNRTVGTASVMNNMEKGIKDAHDRIDGVDSQIKDTAKKTSIEDGKLYLLKSDGTKIDEGTELGCGEVDLSNYVTKEVGNANQITFSDGKTFQEKLDAGELKGDPGTGGVTGSTIYEISLDEWGITNGFLDERAYTLNADGRTYKAKYTNAEYLVAHNNRVGLQNALNYAANNGYTTAVLPKHSEIFFCWELSNANADSYAYQETQIKIPSELTFDMNYSSFKIIFDSFNQNPYDLSQHSDSYPVHNLHGNFLSFSNTHNSKIANGTIIGCRFERAFIDDTEHKIDYGCGIVIEHSSYRTTIENMDVSGFMADGIGATSNHADVLQGNNKVYCPAFSFNGYINSSGVLTELAGTYTTDYLDISQWTAEEGVFRVNIGYATHLETYNQELYISFFDANKNFILSSKERMLQNILIPKKACYIRLTAEKEEPGLTLGFTKTFQFTPMIPEFCTISNCKIHENHRGGISNVINNTVIEKCKIYNNGQGVYEGVPPFHDTTRYAINCEDYVTLKLTVRDCYIANHYHGILYTGNNLTVSNNIFYKCSGRSVALYHCENAYIHNNSFINTGNIAEGLKRTYRTRSCFVDSNRFINSGIELECENMNAHVVNNTFKGWCTYKVLVDDLYTRDLIYDYYNPDSHTTVSLINVKAEGLKDAKINFHEKINAPGKLYLSTDENTQNLEIINKSGVMGNTIICKNFYNTVLDKMYIGESYTDNVSTNVFKNVVLNDTELRYGAVYNAESTLNLTVYDSIFNVEEAAYLLGLFFLNDSKTKTVNITFDSCDFNIKSSSVNCVINYIYLNSTITGTINFNNCRFNNILNTEAKYIVGGNTPSASSNLTINVTNSVFSGSWKYSTISNTYFKFKNDGSSIADNSTICVSSTSGSTGSGSTGSTGGTCTCDTTAIENKIGTLSSLQTNVKTNLVSAINENHSRIVALESNAGNSSGSGNSGTTITDEQIGTAISDYLSKHPIEGATKSRWYGKSWLLVGDSISTEGGPYAPKGYGTYVANNLGLVKTNISVSGRTLKDAYDWINNTTTQYDLITIMMGTNDVPFCGVLGDNSSKDNTTIAGRVDMLIKLVRAKFPNAILAFFTPINRTKIENGVVTGNNSDGYYVGTVGNITYDQVDKVIRDKCALHNVPCLSLLNAIDPRTQELRTKYFMSATDGTHPNELGHAKFIAPLVNDFLEKIAPF